MNEQDTQWLYGKMRSKGINTGTYNDFKRSLSLKEDRDWYYEKSQEFGLDVGTRKEFDELFGGVTSPSVFDRVREKVQQQIDKTQQAKSSTSRADKGESSAVSPDDPIIKNLQGRVSAKPSLAGDAVKPMEVPNLHEAVRRKVNEPYQMGAEVPKVLTPEAVRVERMGTEERVGSALGRVDTEDVAKQVWDEADRRATQQFLDETRGSFAPVEWQGTQAMAAHLGEHDLRRMADEAWTRLGKERQDRLVNDIYYAYKKQYPDATEERLRAAAEESARGLVDRRMYDVAVQQNMPKSAADLFLRKIADNSIGALQGASARIKAGTAGDMLANEDAMRRYEENHKAAGIAGSVASFASDPVTWVSGGVGSAASRGAMMGAARLMGEQAARKFGQGLAGRIFQGVTGGGANFATFESGGEAMSQLKHGGALRQSLFGGDDATGGIHIDEYSGKDILGRAGHGLVMGSTVGAIAPLLGNVSDKLVRATNSTAGKFGLRTAELGVGTVAEGTVFATPEFIKTYNEYGREIESLSNKESENYIADEKERERKIAQLKEKRGEAMMDVWTDNMAMIAGFKLHGLIKSAPQRITELWGKGSKDRIKAKMGFETRLRKALDGQDGLALTKDEQEELLRGGYGDLDELTRAYQDILKSKAKSPEHINPERMIGKGDSDALPYNRFAELVQDGRISESARAKMYYYVTGNTLPMSTVMGYSITENYGKDGNVESYTVSSNGANGVITSRTFRSKERAETEAKKILRQAELNAIDMGEKHRNYVSEERRTDEAIEQMSKETGIPASALRDLVKKKPESMTEQERQTMDMLNSYKKDTEGKYDAQSIRDEVSETYGVDVDKAIRKEPNRRTGEEQQAVDEYAKRLYEGIKTEEQEGAAEAAPATPEEAVVEQKRIEGRKGDGEGVAVTSEAEDAATEADVAESTDAVLEGMVGERTHNQTGRVVPVRVVGREGEFYLVDGNVATTPDGKIDKASSDAELIVTDGSGNRLMVSPDKIEEVGLGIDASDYLEQARLQREAEEDAEREQAGYGEGDGVTLADGREGEVIGVTEDGRYEVAVQGKGDKGYDLLVMTKEELDGAEVRRGQYVPEDVETEPGEEPVEENAEEGETEQVEESETPVETETETETTEMEPSVEGEEAEQVPESRRRYEEIAGKYGERAGHKIGVTLADRVSALEKAEKALAKAQKEYDDAPIGKEEKAEKKLEQAQKAYDEAKAEKESWEAVKAENDREAAVQLEERRKKDEALIEQAQQEEAKRQAEEVEKRAEQEERGAGAAHSAIGAKWNGAEKVEGFEDEITLPNGEVLTGRYILAESGSATPSHDAVNGFVKSEGFPVDENGETVNDRDYERDKEAQEVTRQMGSNYDSRALQSVPVVSREGVVLSGNGRTMAGDLAARDNTDGAYIDYLKRHGRKFGFSAEQVESMKHPRVVFQAEGEMPYTTETFAKFNAQEMKGQSKTEQAVKLGKTVDDGTFNRIVRLMDAFETPGAFYGDRKASSEAIRELQKAGVVNAMQVAEMFDGEKVSQRGQELIENVLIGKAFGGNPDVVRMLSETPSLRQRVVKALMEIGENMRMDERYTLQDELSQAIELTHAARKAGYKDGERVSQFARQQNLFTFDEGATVADYRNATILMLADSLNDSRSTFLKQLYAEYNSRAKMAAAGQMDMFTGRVDTKEDILNDVLELLNAENYGRRTESEEGTGEAEGGSVVRGDEGGNVPDGGRGKSEAGGEVRTEGRREGGEVGEKPKEVKSEGEETAAGGAVAGKGVVSDAVRSAEEATETNPSEGQKKAGNYKKGHVRIDGFDVSIENPKGSVRRGTDASGKQWEQEMQNTYGYIRGTEGVDGDHIDVFFSEDPSQGDVFVVDQVNKDGSFDEHKVMYGFPDIESARKAYLSNYEDGWQGLGAITPVSKEEFKKWIDSSHRKTKPFAEYSSVKPLGDTKLGEQPNKPTVKAGEDYVSAAERIAKEHEVKHTAAHFPMETQEEAMAFDKRVPEMDDAELLAYMQADGKGNINKASHPSVYDEYDYRYGDEIADTYEDTLTRLQESSTTLEQAEEMLANIHGNMERLATEERPLLLGQEEALQEYIDGLKNMVPDHYLSEHIDRLAALQGNKKTYDENAYEAYAAGRMFGNGVNISLSKKEAYDLADKMIDENKSRGGVYILPFLDGIGDSMDLRLGRNKDDVAKREKEYREMKTGKPSGINSRAWKQKSDTDSTSPSLSEHERITRDALIDLMRESGMEVITDVEEAQRVLDEENGVGTDLRLMGTRVESRKSEIAEALKDKEMNEEQRAVVSVFTGKKNNVPLIVTDMGGKERRVVMRQGHERRAGTKHSIFGHYGTSSNGYTAEEIFLIPDVIKNGKRKQNESKGISYSYERDGVKYTVTTEIKGKGELFTNFYTNRKPTVAEQGTQNTDEQRVQPQQSVSGAKLQKVSEPTKEHPTFYSNAERAVEGIRQGKATPEQWLAMIQKVGGLKAGEDKWLGLSDWLKDSKEKTLTKQQVLDFINKNMIEVEEVHYSETEDQELFADYKREYKEYYDQAVAEGEDDPQGVAWQRMVDEHGDDFELGFYAYGDELHWDDDNDYINYEKDQIDADRKINETRLRFTTSGLENNKEIALTVPTIESWNSSDEVHFGDAGEGRAVAWVRFGETTDADGNKVLVIDEVQSKRHQEGREKGYKKDILVKGHIGDYEKVTDKLAYADVTNENGIMIGQIMRQNGKFIALDQRRQRIDFKRYDTESEALASVEVNAGVDPDSTHIPDAPFEKNWHELAMKRMLRYAAENGYDKVAWTKGEQQAERYDLSKVIDEIAYWKEGDGLWGISAGDRRDSQKIDQQTFTEKELIETFGKEIAERILNDEGVSESVLGYPDDPNVHYLNGETIKIGGEGMKGFYDKMLPSFMNKYGKKWNVKVGEVELPEVEEAGRKMWSVDVTPEMKASVKEGQPMFFRTSDGTAYGFTTNGKTYIDPRIATSETPLHEYAHLWAQALRGASPKAWEQLKEQILGKEDVRQYVQRLYPELHGDSLAEEIFTTFAGRRGQQRLQEEREKMLKQTGGIFGKAQVIELFDRIRRAVRQFWNMARDLFSGRMPDSDLSRLSAEDFADMMTSDLMNGFDPTARTREMRDIKEKAIQDGTFLKAPNGKDSHLNERQWIHVRTKDFKNWFGDWEKAARIEKLRKSEPVDVKFNNEYDMERDSAKRWMKENLRDEYVNSDTGEKIQVSKVGVNEVTSHGSKDVAHLKSLVAIPGFIRKSVFIDEIKNTKDNDKYDSYRYYVCGAKIDGEDYTVKVVIGVKGDSKYYDHRLTQIEKGTLIDNLNGLSNSVAENQNANNSTSKDGKLLSILQTNSSKVIDPETGEPKVFWNGSLEDINVFDTNKIRAVDYDVDVNGFWFTDNKDMAHPAFRTANVQKAVFLSVKNPAPYSKVREVYKEVLEDMELDASSRSTHDEVRRRLQAMGYDGVYVEKRPYVDERELEENSYVVVQKQRGRYVLKKEEDGTIGLYTYGGKETPVGQHITGYDDVKDYLDSIDETIIAFTPTQIKSATENVGTYDGENGDIRYAKKMEIGRGRETAEAEYGKLYSEREEVGEMSAEELDKAYLDAVEKGDMETVQKMVEEAMRRNEYASESDYQGTSAFNGSAPSTNAYYETREERMKAFEAEEFEGDMSLGDMRAGLDKENFLNRLGYEGRNAKRGNTEYDAMKAESADALTEAMSGKKKTIRMYRSVPNSVKEGKFRNGDWITPSRKYAEENARIHGWGDDYRIIEEEVSIDDVWWDGNDLNEWGYDNGKEYAYRNTENNRKSLDPITYDEEGNVIPLSKRFDLNKESELYSEREQDAVTQDQRRTATKKTLMGVHNISEEKLRKAIRQGGLANPSLAVIDTDNGIHSDFGDISLIPKSMLIDSETGRNAGTYTGDAWTPTYPNVHTQLTKQGGEHIDRMAKEAAKGDKELEYHLRSNLLNYIEGANDITRMLYLIQKGIEPEIVPQRTTHSQDEFDAIQKIFGEGTTNMPTDMTKEQNDALLDLMVSTYEKKLREKENPGGKFYERIKELNDQRIKEYRDSLTDENGKIWFAKGDTFVFDNWRDEKRRKEGTPDWYWTDNAARDKVTKEGLTEDFEKWKEGLFGEGDIEEVLFAGFDRDGNRKYLPNTLANASLLMNKEADTNAYNDGGLNATRSGLLKKMLTLSAIRKNKNLLQGEDKYEEKQKEMSDKLFGIIEQVSDMQQISDNKFSNIDYAEARLQEAITRRDPVAYLNKEYGYHIDRDGELAKEIAEFKKEASNLPVKYFETKFRRPVGLNEFSVAVVPENTSADVVKALQDAGLDVRTYDGTEEDRKAVTLEAVSDRNDVLFRDESTKDSNDRLNKFLGDYSETETPSSAETIGSTATETGEKLGVKVRLIHSRDELPKGWTEKQKRNRRGWYDKQSGEVVIVVPNNRSEDEAVGTVLHEVVGHKGLRELFGEDFGTFLDNVYRNVDGETRRKITEKAKRKGWDFRTATEEYLSDLAEVTDFEAMKKSGVWSKIKDLFIEMLRKAGIRLKHALTDADLRYILWRSHENMKEGGRRGVFGEAKDVAMREKTGIDKSEAREEKTYAEGEREAEAVNARFNEELERQIAGTLPKGHVYKLGMPGVILRSAGFPDMPIELSSSHLSDKRMQKNHPFELSDIKDLPKALQHPIAIFSYGDKKKAQNVIVELTRNGKNFLVGVHFNQDRNGIFVSDIRGLFPKDNVEWLNWISQGKSLYMDKEKIQTLIAQQQINPAEVDYLDLDDVQRKVESFKNPNKGIKQGFGSAETSLNQIPAAMRKIDWKKGSTNVDIGGGRFDKSTEYLAGQGVENLVFDPFNRDSEHNRRVAERVRDRKAETATVNNVLNVIDTEESRANVILQAAKAIKPDGTAYFSVYEGDKSGNGRQTKSDSWQNNLPTREYVREVERYFEDVSLKNGVITAKNPKATDEKSVWNFDGKYDGNSILFSEREESEEPRKRTMIEEQMLALDKLAESHKDNVNIRRMAIEAMNGQMSRIGHAMSVQKEYDKGTVDGIVRLARTLMEMHGTSPLTRGEVKKLLSQVRQANGRKDITKQAGAVFDLLQQHQEAEAAKLLEKVMKVKGSKVGASGVKMMGRLDAAGEETLRAMRESMMLDETSLKARKAEAMERLHSEDEEERKRGAAELEGVNLAMDYADNIRKSEAEDSDLRRSLDEAKAEVRSGRMSREAYAELEKEVMDNIRLNRGERIESYKNLIAALSDRMSASARVAKAFREAEYERANEIRHNANSDMQGIPAYEHGGDDNLSRMGRLSNIGLVRFLLKPLGTFDEMLRKFGEKSVDGRGYLWNRFMRGVTDASDQFSRNLRQAHRELDEKVSEVMGKKMRWSDLFGMERKMPKVTLTWMDGVRERSFELSQGNLLYIYMVNKMSDGRMKLRKMGITEEMVDAIKKRIDPRFIELGDWLQNDFLKRKGSEYAKVYERMYGTSMPRVENYFPLKINSNSRGQNVDLSKEEDAPLASTITGGVIQRVRNTTALDLTSSNAFDVVLGHLEEMEHWASYSELTRDINTLLSYKGFRNRLKSMNTLRFGSGDTLWQNFRDASSMVVGQYRPEVHKRDSFDKIVTNIAKGVTQSKISFRFYTALKQLLSSPAYLSEASLFNLMKNNPVSGGLKAWNWAMENLPGFEERWMSRQAGDTRLQKTDADWKWWKYRLVDTLSRWGMSPNAFVDAVTVACGAKAIYETKKSRYLQEGYPEREAEKRALQDASISYNETQQSSEAAYLSTMQVDRTVLSNALTVFRNASMAYQRRFARALAKMRDYMTPGYKEQSVDYMRKQLERDGLGEDEALNVARERYGRGWKTALADVALFGWVLQFAWDLGPYMVYLLFGNDDDKKKEMLEDAAMHALWGGVEGMAGGSVISELGHNFAHKGTNLYGYNMSTLPLMSEVQNIVGKIGSDKDVALYMTVNLLAQSVLGLNPETITNWAIAIDDACGGDFDTQTEVVVLIARLMNAPESQIKELYIDELGVTGEEARKMPIEEVARRYGEYKAKREIPLLYPLEDKETQEARIAKKAKTFKKSATERMKQHAPEWEKKLDEYRNGEYKEANKAYKAYQSGESEEEPDWKMMERREIYKDYMRDIRLLEKGGDNEEADELKKELVGELESIK